MKPLRLHVQTFEALFPFQAFKGPFVLTFQSLEACQRKNEAASPSTFLFEALSAFENFKEAFSETFVFVLSFSQKFVSVSSFESH